MVAAVAILPMIRHHVNFSLDAIQANSLGHTPIKFIPLCRAPGINQGTERKTEALCSCITPRVARELLEFLEESYPGKFSSDCEPTSSQFAAALEAEPPVLESAKEFFVEQCTFEITEADHVDFLYEYLDSDRFGRLRMCQRMNYWTYGPDGSTITMRMRYLADILVRLARRYSRQRDSETISVLPKHITFVQSKTAMVTESFAHYPRDTEVYSYELTSFPKPFLVHVLVGKNANLIGLASRPTRQEIIWEMLKRVVARAMAEVQYGRSCAQNKSPTGQAVLTNGHSVKQGGGPNWYTSQGDITPPED